jgi:hypothetical protein
MKSARVLFAAAALACNAPAFAEEVPAEACIGQNCMQENAKPAEECEGQDCAQLPSQDMTDCTGQDCDAIETQPGSGPQIETPGTAGDQ